MHLELLGSFCFSIPPPRFFTYSFHVIKKVSSCKGPLIQNPETYCTGTSFNFKLSNFTCFKFKHVKFGTLKRVNLLNPGNPRSVVDRDLNVINFHQALCFCAVLCLAVQSCARHSALWPCCAVPCRAVLCFALHCCAFCTVSYCALLSCAAS